MSEILRADNDYGGSVGLVRKRMAALRPREVRAAQRTGYRPGQVLQVDWAEMPTRPKIAGRERRVYALICSLPFSGASTAHFSFDMTIESFLEGHVRALSWLGGVPRECVYDNLRSVVARRDDDVRDVERTLRAAARPLRLSRDSLQAGHAAREGLGRGRCSLLGSAGTCCDVDSGRQNLPTHPTCFDDRRYVAMASTSTASRVRIAAAGGRSATQTWGSHAYA